VYNSRLEGRALIAPVGAPAWPGRYENTEDHPSILIQPSQCCLTPNFHMFFLRLCSHRWVLTIRVVSCAIPRGRDPTSMCKTSLGWSFAGRCPSAGERCLQSPPDKCHSAWPRLSSTAAAWATEQAGASCQLKDTRKRYLDCPGGEQLLE